MSAQLKIACVVGTRPEAIKMAPVVFALREAAHHVSVVASGQHSEMLTQALSGFGIEPDVNLSVMREAQTLDHVTSAVIEGVGRFLDEAGQDVLLVHGDTTTTLGAAMAGFYRGVPVGHVEAGLRSGDMRRPFPEEANRVLTDKLSTLFFAPTELAAANLRAEGADEARIFVTGNTVIDALFMTLRQNAARSGLPKGAVLLTAHRRESWGAPMERICEAVRRVMEERPGLRLVVPLHKNPAVRSVIKAKLGGIERVTFTEPLDYPSFVAAMNDSLFILSDSGGVQEEASALGKPVLILRELSERPEALTDGTGVLVGTDEARIEAAALRLIDDEAYRGSFAAKRGKNPFGDGRAAERIRKAIENFFGLI
ncbi:MAG: UDP-N-acetylglucosamine 2-epimerase (non-hydrolyzing) [Synergistaceae bacterium]|jgi:UDP-N-acetylglucosamine 2-epimerase (non-hydrolysing)|nr:UDP-N-acetylglucosamine 2-epimerase (non-hydrolyzing) [Synergistaceae bacterium]